MTQREQDQAGQRVLDLFSDAHEALAKLAEESPEMANVERGTLEDGAIALDLIQDTSSYVWRSVANPATPIPTLPGGGVSGGF